MLKDQVVDKRINSVRLSISAKHLEVYIGILTIIDLNKIAAKVKSFVILMIKNEKNG